MAKHGLKVLEVAAEEYGFLINELLDGGKGRKQAEAKYLAAKIMWEVLGMQQMQIAKVLNRKCHTSISHGIWQVTGYLSYDSETQAHYNNIKAKILTIEF
jgi:chromosomal replication initiation ATPase DnaA